MTAGTSDEVKRSKDDGGSGKFPAAQYGRKEEKKKYHLMNAGRRRQGEASAQSGWPAASPRTAGPDWPLRVYFTLPCAHAQPLLEIPGRPSEQCNYRNRCANAAHQAPPADRLVVCCSSLPSHAASAVSSPRTSSSQAEQHVEHHAWIGDRE